MWKHGKHKNPHISIRHILLLYCAPILKNTVLLSSRGWTTTTKNKKQYAWPQESQTQSRCSDLAHTILPGWGSEAVIITRWHKSAWLFPWRHMLLKCHSLQTPHSNTHKIKRGLFFQPLHIREKSVQGACFASNTLFYIHLVQHLVIYDPDVFF